MLARVLAPMVVLLAWWCPDGGCCRWFVASWWKLDARMLVLVR
jgi:hypothetical protein